VYEGFNGFLEVF